MSRRFWFLPRAKHVGGFLGLTTIGVGMAAKYDEGFKRCVTFWVVAMPPYLHYCYVDWATKNLSYAERARRFEPLHDKYSPIVRDAALDIRGFYLKAAQMMSTREDFVPPQYIEWCEKVQNEAPVLLDPKNSSKYC